jgi:hypothetical protein
MVALECTASGLAYIQPMQSNFWLDVGEAVINLVGASLLGALVGALFF